MSNVENDLRLTFERATLRDTLNKLEMLPSQSAARLWREAKKVQVEHATLQLAEINDYENSYQQRVGTRVQELIEENGRHEPVYDMMDRSGTRKTQAQLRAQADREVRLGHENRLQALKEREYDALVTINRQAGKLLRSQGKAVEEFTRAHDGPQHDSPSRTGPRH